MAWRITSGPEKLDPYEYDGMVTGFELVREDDHSERRFVRVMLSGSAASMGEEGLPPRVADLRRTEGRSEVERVLDLDDPPAKIEASSSRVLVRT
jgi:hypothetical protein